MALKDVKANRSGGKGSSRYVTRVEAKTAAKKIRRAEDGEAVNEDCPCTHWRWQCRSCRREVQKNDDFLAELVAKRTAANPAFPALIEAAKVRRQRELDDAFARAINAPDFIRGPVSRKRSP